MSNPPAGWYDDPAGDPSLQRFWDGAQWTNQTQPRTPAPPPPAAYGGPGVQSVETPMPPAPGYGGPGVQSVETPMPPAPGYGGPGGQPVDSPMPPGPGGPGAPMPPGGPGGGGGIGGIRTDLLSDAYAEKSSGERVMLQNSKMLKVVLGPDLLARQGSMVAFQGRVDFDHESAGMAKFLKKAVTGEGVPLMRCTGQGEVFLAEEAHDVHIIHLDGAALTVNGRNILAFEPSLSWDIEKVQGAGMMAGGLFNTRLQGHGWVAVTTDGTPVVLETDQPTFVDAQAAVAWSSNLSTSINKTIKAKALVGRGSGEAFQLAFQGQGLVIVQPSEGPQIPSAGGGGGGIFG